MRFFGLGAMVMSKIGVSTQLLAGGDIYPALEKGVIDAGDKITDEEKGPVEEAVKELKEALESEELSAIQENTATLSQAAMKIGEKLYKQEQEAAGPEGQGAKEDSDIVDADYEEVKEEAEEVKGAKAEEVKEEEKN